MNGDELKNICICGGGNLGTVIAGSLRLAVGM